MCKLIERLVSEGYVNPERQAELLERAHNMERGHGFLRTADLTPSIEEHDALDDILN